MFKFGHIELLWGLMLIPCLLLVFIWFMRWRKNSFHKYGEMALLKQLAPNVSFGKPVVKIVLLSLALMAFVIGIADPQLGTKLEEVKREGVDIMVALDVSNSMLAEDFQPNRLEKSKRIISRLIESLHSDRLGIVVFGGDAYVQLPITTDYAAAKLFLSTINTGIIPTQGTNIGAAINLSMQSFNFESATGKSIIIITDGENHEQNAVEAAESANEKGVVIHTIGMGSEQGAPIPIYRNGRQVDFRKNKEGDIVVSKLNETMLREISSKANGIYVRSSNAQSGLNIILEQINRMDKTEFGTKVYTDYENRFQYFFFIGVVLIILEFVISGRKTSWISNIKLFEKNNA